MTISHLVRLNDSFCWFPVALRLRRTDAGSESGLAGSAGAIRPTSPTPPGGGEKSASVGSTGRLVEETTSYIVQNSDTLTSVAARFDTTPSELVSLNKLHSRLIFPGQVSLTLTALICMSRLLAGGALAAANDGRRPHISAPPFADDRCCKYLAKMPMRRPIPAKLVRPMLPAQCHHSASPFPTATKAIATPARPICPRPSRSPTTMVSIPR